MKIQGIVNPQIAPSTMGVGGNAANAVLKMIPAQRMAGETAVWSDVAPVKAAVMQRVTMAAQGVIPGQSFAATLAYAAHDNAPPTATPPGPEPFGAGDLVDMINPLQQAPIIGDAYRQVTGDTIKPIGTIIGGAIFGGPIGAAIGLVNVIAQQETGQDITGNVLTALRGNDDTSQTQTAENTTPNQPHAFRLTRPVISSL